MPESLSPSAPVERTTPTAREPVPSANPSQTRRLLGGIFLVVSVAAALWLVYQLRSVILLVVLALLFAYLVAPLVEMVHQTLTRRNGERALPRAVAIGLVYAGLFAAIGIAVSVLLPRLGVQFTLLGQQAPAYLAAARGRLQAWRYLVNPDHFPAAIRDAVAQGVTQSTDLIGGYLTFAVASLLQLLGYLPWIFLVPILAFFLLKDAEDFRRTALLALPYGRLRADGAELFEEINNALAAYIRAGLIACLLIGVVCTIAFIIMGVPYALLLGVAAGLLEFIPLVGPLVVAVGAVLIAGFHSIGHAIAVLLFLGILRIAQDYVIYPRLIGRGIHMHPLAVILAILCGAELAGVAGIFLAIPVVAVLSVVYRHWLQSRGGSGLVAGLLSPRERPVAVPVPSRPVSGRAG